MLDGTFRMVGIVVDPAQSGPRPSGVGIERHGAFQHDPGSPHVTQNRVHGSEHREYERIVSSLFSSRLCMPKRFTSRHIDVIGPVINQALCMTPAGERERHGVLWIYRK